MAASSDPDVIQKKIANAFYTDEQLSKEGYGGGDLGLMLVRIFMKGLWLGGNVYLTSTTLKFELNNLNKLFHSGNVQVEIPLTDITQVTVIKPILGFMTIQLTIPDGDFKIRVRGAKEFASLIEETAAKAKSKLR
ncbi:MAG TPA: hypothetical protein VHL11_05405 [Phototrophicaceae bacterium]|jgi:hypothetical protein|nr:hypothetical protein [Phototrophicaceae bacterium]